jgi:hypothetical protein
MRDRSRKSLQWRYADHPQNRFQMLRIDRDGEFIGYVVYLGPNEDGTCVIYELMVLHPSHLRAVASSFINYCLDDVRITNLRMTINESHPFSVPLRKMGFLRRNDTTVFQIYMPKVSAVHSASCWFLTAGDKDV